MRKISLAGGFDRRKSSVGKALKNGKNVFLGEMGILGSKRFCWVIGKKIVKNGWFWIENSENENFYFQNRN